MFYAGDIRKGQGERRFFRVCFAGLAKEYPETCLKLVDLIPEYNRWDSIFSLEGSSLEKEMYFFLHLAFKIDLEKVRKGEPISLLSKWLPSINSSSEKTRARAKALCKAWKISQKDYRKALSFLRGFANVVEKKMSSNLWNKIDYEKVPSKANLRYSSAFQAHDPKRRNAYIDSVAKGEAKINSSVLYPYDIVHKINSDPLQKATNTLLWKNLPDYLEGREDSILCVVDGSGSMMSRLSNKTSVTALEVAHSLGIYFSERLNGPFKDRFVTFSENPQWVDLSRCGGDLYKKIRLCQYFSEVANTDLYKVFEMILKVAKENQLDQKDLPTKILVISDMEFDRCSCDYLEQTTIFELVKREFEASGYKFPQIVFWNVNSRTCAIPAKKGKGVTLVSGFSPALTSMILSGKTDPWEILKEKLEDDRYSIIGKRVKCILQ